MQKPNLQTSLLVALLLSLSVFLPSEVSAASTGATSGTSFSTTGSGVAWGTPSNAQSSNNVFATSTLSNGQNQSQKLRATGFNFNLPINASITGIEVTAEYSASTASRLGGTTVQLVKASTTVNTYTGSTSALWATSELTSTYGGSTQLWGTTWTAADINASNFGVEFAASHSTGGSAEARLDHLTINVYYTALPTISLTFSTSTITNQDVTVTATSTANSTLNATSHTFTANGSFDFVATNVDGTATSTATVTNIDKEAPVIASSTDIEDIEATSVSGATVTYTTPAITDNNLGATVSCLPASGSTFALGTTGVICNGSDVAGNSATSTTFNVTVVDTTSPVIVLIGADPLTVEAGTVFVDPGATATDASGDFAATSTNNVDTGTLGVYTVTYTATDASGNIASSTIRTVNVVDTTLPAAPTAVSPIANAILTSSALAVLDWSDVVDFSSPVTYSYQLSNSNTTNLDGTFVTPIASGSALLTSEASTTLATEGDYYYIAQATDAQLNAGLWMSPVKFTIDNTAPVITVTGSSSLTVEGGSVYIDDGATALDTVDGPVSVSSSGSVDTSITGTYTITYTATDTAGNTATSTRSIEVVDTTAPVITLLGSDPVTIEAGSTYTDAGATVSDNISTPITATASGTVSTFVVGTYVIEYNAVDGSGNVAATVTRTVNVVDTTAPVINITGQNPNIVTINNVYVDSGATASDLVDGIITVTSTSTVDTATLGTYAVTYFATDLSGNSASASRSVIVIPPDTTAPVITILGTNPLTIEGGSLYIDAGATALDNVNGNLTSSIVTVNGVIATSTGSYTVTYDVSDGAGNPATQGVRNVTVVDTTAPVLTVNGTNPLTLHIGDTYTELGATATDAVDQAVVVVVGGDTVTTTATSTFVVSYTASDASGNPAIPVSRTVYVVDIAVPIITIVGSSTVDVEFGSTYTDAGATALDDADGDISANIVTSGSVNTSTLGAYTLSYDVSDSSGNAAITTNRTVNVVDTTAPVVTVTGSSTVVLTVGDTYTEDGATADDLVDGSLTPTITGTVDTNTVGTYTLIYSATDLSGNTGTSSRDVIVNAAPDTTAPIITILGTNPVTITVGGVFTDEGATSTDNVDVNLPITATSTVNTSVVGTYTVTYNTTDNSGNAAIPMVRTVNVVAATETTTQTQQGQTGGGGAPVALFTNSGAGANGGSNNGAGNNGATGVVLGEATFQFTKNLGLGSRGNDVIELQKRLKAEGFFKFNVTTGFFGPVTLQAVKAYQTAHGIKPVSGFVGVLTRAELNK